MSNEYAIKGVVINWFLGYNRLQEGKKVGSYLAKQVKGAIDFEKEEVEC